METGCTAKSIVRMIMGANWEPMFANVGILKLGDIKKYVIVVFMHCYHIEKIPSFLVCTDYFKMIQHVQCESYNRKLFYV